MLVGFATWITVALELYLAAGVVFAVAFVTVGVERVDPSAHGGTRGFRMLILPGAAALWPLLLRRWLAGAGPPEERSAHRLAAARRRPEGPPEKGRTP